MLHGGVTISAILLKIVFIKKLFLNEITSKKDAFSIKHFKKIIFKLTVVLTDVGI